MIVSCPICESRFNIDPDRISPRGRQVRCGKCGHVWRIAADGSAMAVDVGNPQPSDPETSNNLSEADKPAITMERTAPEPEEVPNHAASDLLEAPAAADAAPAAPENLEEDKAVDTTSLADSIPPLAGPRMTPNARQKLAEARKSRSRTRFLLIALILMIVVAIAVSFIQRPGTFNDALRLVPGLDNGNAN